jgi:hypothetical protein
MDAAVAPQRPNLPSERGINSQNDHDHFRKEPPFAARSGGEPNIVNINEKPTPLAGEFPNSKPNGIWSYKYVLVGRLQRPKGGRELTDLFPNIGGLRH